MVVVTGLQFLLSGCLGSVDRERLTRSSKSDSPSEIEVGDAGAAGPIDFDATIAPILDPKCTLCHASPASPKPWAIPNPDLQSALFKWPNLIGASGAASLLVTKGAHAGPAFTDAEKQIVIAWIDQVRAQPSASSTDGGALTPVIAPIDVTLTGTNTIDLAALDAALAGIQITFTANTTGHLLELSNVMLTTTKGSGVALSNLLWVTVASGVDQVSMLNYVELDQEVDEADSQPLGPGTFFVADYELGDQLTLAFSSAKPAKKLAPMGCKNVSGFISTVLPLLTTPATNSEGGGAMSCLACHGANGMGQGAFDLSSLAASNLATDAAAQATACETVRRSITPDSPTDSQLLTEPDPNSTEKMPFKFTATAYSNFSQVVQTWIDTEK